MDSYFEIQGRKQLSFRGRERNAIAMTEKKKIWFYDSTNIDMAKYFSFLACANLILI